MDTYTIFGIVCSVSLIGLSGALAFWLLNQRRKMMSDKSRRFENISDEGAGQINETESVRRRLRFPKGARRTTSVHGVNASGYLRHTDGSYTRGYHVKAPATLYAEDNQVDRLYNDWARMLQSIKQQNCIVQIRHDVRPDCGRALHAHIKAQSHPKDAYIPARMLHTVGIAGTESAMRAAQYQDDRLTLWVRVPVRHSNDHSRARLRSLAGFFPALTTELRRLGFVRFMYAVAASWTRSNIERLCFRVRHDEEAACDAATQVFASVEGMCPLELEALTRDEMWREVYLSHRLNEHESPLLADVEGMDLRQHLCGEEISSSGAFLMHGDYPVAIVSLFRPPTPIISAGMLRVMTANPNLVFRHTTVVEYITLDQERVKTRLKSQSKDLSRAQTATARKSPTPNDDDPEALAAQRDIKHLREEMAGGRESLIEARVYTIIYGERARSRAELRDSIKELEERCRHVVAAFGRIPGTDAAREAPEALRALYPQTIAGEASTNRTGREFTETTRALARLAPLEGVWRGSSRPHTLVTTPSQHLIGFDLFDANEVPSPLGLLLAGSRGGKSVLLSEIITNALATIKKLRVRVVDYGNSQEPLVTALGGRHLKFDPNERATINIWDYPGLEQGAPPTELQKWYVVQDALQLARVEMHNAKNASAPENAYARFAEDMLTLMVREVYNNEVPRNASGRPKHEPRARTFA